MDLRPIIGLKPWLGVAQQPARRVLRVPGMILPEERLMLYWFARNYFQGAGHIVDAGCFQGASTAARAAGLADRGWTSPVIDTYDRFLVEGYEIPKWFPEGSAGTSFRALFDAHIEEFRDLVLVHDGDVTELPAPLYPVEILFVDLAKTPAINDRVATQFFPRLIAGRSVVIQQDYLHEKLPWIHVTMEYFADYFSIVADTDQCSVVFTYDRLIPPDLLDTLVSGPGAERAPAADGPGDRPIRGRAEEGRLSGSARQRI